MYAQTPRAQRLIKTKKTAVKIIKLFFGLGVTGTCSVLIPVGNISGVGPEAGGPID